MYGPRYHRRTSIIPRGAPINQVKIPVSIVSPGKVHINPLIIIYPRLLSAVRYVGDRAQSGNEHGGQAVLYLVSQYLEYLLFFIYQFLIPHPSIMSEIKQSSDLEISKPQFENLISYPVLDVATGVVADERRHAFYPVLSFVEKLSSRVGAETVGCERIPEEDRDPTQSPWSMFSVWTTTNLLISAFSTGSLGPLVYGLGFWDSFCCIIFFHALGNLAVGFYSFMSFQLGMRSVIIARYSFGFWAVRIMVFLNALTCIGVCDTRRELLVYRILIILIVAHHQYHQCI